MHEVNHWSYKSLLCLSQVRIAIVYICCHIFVYFLEKPKKADGHSVSFHCALLGCSLFVHINPLRTLYVGAPGVCEVWW